MATTWQGKQKLETDEHCGATQDQTLDLNNFKILYRQGYRPTTPYIACRKRNRIPVDEFRMFVQLNPRKC